LLVDERASARAFSKKKRARAGSDSLAFLSTQHPRCHRCAEPARPSPKLQPAILALPPARSLRLLEPLLAVAVGVASGLYIFDAPLREARAERERAARGEAPPASASAPPPPAPAKANVGDGGSSGGGPGPRGPPALR